MRVAFERKSKNVGGMIFKQIRPFVVCTVDFTDEEKRIIKEKKLQRNSVWMRQTGQFSSICVTVADLLKGPSWHQVEHDFEAAEYEKELLQGLEFLKTDFYRDETYQEPVKIIEL